MRPTTLGRGLRAPPTRRDPGSASLRCRAVGIVLGVRPPPLLTVVRPLPRDQPVGERHEDYENRRCNQEETHLTSFALPPSASDMEGMSRPAARTCLPPARTDRCQRRLFASVTDARIIRWPRSWDWSACLSELARPSPPPTTSSCGARGAMRRRRGPVARSEIGEALRAIGDSLAQNWHELV